MVLCDQDLDQKLFLQLYTWLLIGTHIEKVPLTKLSDRGGQHKYRLGVFVYQLGKLLVELTSEITNNVTRGLQNVGKRFTNQLAGLLTVISA